MSNDFDWNDITLILSLARSGSMSATARELGLDASTVSRRIASAEKALKLRLFIRDNTRYQMTEAGKVFVEYGEAVYGNVQSMLLASSSEAAAVAGAVRLTSIDFLFDYWLAAHLPAFGEAHPQLELHLLGDNNNLSFTRREADLALRVSKPEADAALVMRKLGDFGFAVFSSAAAPAVPRVQWGAQRWIGYADEMQHLPEMRWLDERVPEAHRGLRLNSLSTVVRACQAGAGLALLPCLMDGQDGLRRLSHGPELQREMWLLSHRDTGGMARFKVVSAWLARLYEENAQMLSGA